jgi:hypothetical protein
VDSTSTGCTNKNEMAAVICPKCGKVIYVPDSPVQLEKDFVICCDEVIYIINEVHDRKNES